MPSGGEITQRLEALRRGDHGAQEQLAQLVYADLHARATQYMRQERRDHTLQPTALVNEVFLKLLRGQEVDWKNRAHFLAVASTVMRRILVDHARRRAAAKRPAAAHKVELAEYPVKEPPRIERLVILDEALNQLAAMDERQARLVEMMYFGGLTEEEAAETLGVSVRTVKRLWASARAWLQATLRRNGQ